MREGGDGRETLVTTGTRVRGTDGAGGWVSRVVVDAAALTVTHLVVEPEDRHEPGRLVPLDLVHQLDITKRQVRHLPRVNRAFRDGQAS
jgi:hypothetical protein